MGQRDGVQQEDEWEQIKEAILYIVFSKVFNKKRIFDTHRSRSRSRSR